MKSVLLLAVLAFASNCERPSPAVVISDPVIVPPPDPLPTPIDEELLEAPTFSCVSACTHLRNIECPVAAETPEGSKCEEVCENSFQIPALAWDVEGLTTTETCPQ